MSKRSSKQKDRRQVARSKLGATVPGSKPTKSAPNKAKPPRPGKKQDVKDIERADSEGMAQQQGMKTKPRQKRG